MRILYFEGEPRWEYKFIRRAVEDDPSVEIFTVLRTTQNKTYRQSTTGVVDAHELENGFPTKAGRSFPVRRIDYRQRGSKLFQQRTAGDDSRFCRPARRRRALSGRAVRAFRWRLRENADGRNDAVAALCRKRPGAGILPQRRSPMQAARASSRGSWKIAIRTLRAGRRCRRWRIMR